MGACPESTLRVTRVRSRPIKEGFTHGGVFVAVVGKIAYALEGQITPLCPELFRDEKGRCTA